MRELGRLIMQGLPKVALEVGAELPDLAEVAEVVNLVPTFRMRAGGSLIEAQVALLAAYGDAEIAVRADGMSLPVLHPAPRRGLTRARCIRVNIEAQQEAANKLVALGLGRTRRGRASSRRATRRSDSGARASPS